jgi:hypothetical protein
MHRLLACRLVGFGKDSIARRSTAAAAAAGQYALALLPASASFAFCNQWIMLLNIFVTL